MSFPQLFITLIFLLGTMPISSYSGYRLRTPNANDINRAVVSRTITVDQHGGGDFKTVQQAIDSVVPSTNKTWILIHVRAGIYFEKVTIAAEKRFIALEGEGSGKTIIAFGDGGNSIESTTFKMFADNFVARDISFVNTYNRGTDLPIINDYAGHKILWAPAALIMGDKASFYRCGFASVQDTLSDFQGRHYYESCYIEGAVDFIWGNGQSYFTGCNINVTTSILGVGFSSYITAQGREALNQATGYVFHSSHVFGTGPAFLGRAFRQFSRVLFYNCLMDNILIPQGWDAWTGAGHEDLITFAEVGCHGPGYDVSKRVPWEKQLGVKELDTLINVNKFINQDGWLQSQIQ